MKTMLSSRRRHYVTRVSILLIVVALIAGMVGCGGGGVTRYDLTISSRAGGSVTTPGVGTFTYDAGTVVNLVATPDIGYQFNGWTGDVSTVGNVNASETIITTNGNYEIIANFHDSAGSHHNLSISSSDGGSVTTPGEGTFTYGTDTLVNLVAQAEDGYWFVRWTGDVDTIDDVNAANTNINVNNHYSIIAVFVPEDFEAVWDWYDLYAIRNSLNSSYILMNDLDSATPGYEELVSPVGTGGIGWQPIGTSAQRFIGALDGQGYEISNLFISRPTTSYVGLFGYVGAGGVIKNISLVDAYATGNQYVGGLTGRSYIGTVANCHSNITVIGSQFVGGLIGAMSSSNVSNSSASGSVASGTSSGVDHPAGGLIGESSSSIINNSYSTCIVTGNQYIGGLVGRDNGSNVTNCHSSGNVRSISSHAGGLIASSSNYTTVSNSYSTGTVTAPTLAGGLIGVIDYGTVSSSFATGTATGSEYIGGLIGYFRESLLTNSYSTGAVTGVSRVGGLIGSQHFGTVNNCYSRGSVNGTSPTGGLVGDRDYGSVTNSFWDKETSGQSTSHGGTGKNTTEMQDVVTFQSAGWHIISVAPDESNPVYLWNIVDDLTYPFLSWQPVS